MRKIIFLLCGVPGRWQRCAWAHHSYGATYDSKKEIKLEGKLVQFVYRNPHSFVHVQAPDDTGAMQRWAVEWSGTVAAGQQRRDARVAEGRRRRSSSPRGHRACPASTAR